MPLPHESSSNISVKPLATLTPPSNSRAWQTAPHPTLPIVATACSDKTARVYSLTSFSLVHTISGGHKRSIRALSWKPGVKGQSVLATASFDASAGIWRRDEGKLEEDYTPRRGTDEDDEEDDADDYQFCCLLEGHESEVKSISWSPSGQYLATCGRDKSVWIWEELEDDNVETVAVLQEHDQDVKCVAWHPEEDLLASSSYDDTIRLYREDVDDWQQVALINAHKETVWWVEFEGSGMAQKTLGRNRESLTDKQKEYLDLREKSGPRLLSTSDDRTVRIWHRVPKEGHEPVRPGMPSIIRSYSLEEDWVQETILPNSHDRFVYSASWSRRTGLIVSAGSDGKIVVYKERWKEQAPNGTSTNGDITMSEGTPEDTQNLADEQNTSLTEWVVIAELFSAHDVFEVNHVTWAQRFDKGKGEDEEEVIVSTGDDGEVKVWTLEAEDT